MSEPRNPKPRPARLPESKARAPAVKPTPARELTGTEPREPTSSAPSAEQGAPQREADASEVVFESEGVTWRVRVLGRSGRAADRSPTLLLLGFWKGDTDREAPAREAMVVGRALSELTSSRLEIALAGSSLPPSGRRKPFFEGAGQGRRDGGPRRGS